MTLQFDKFAKNDINLVYLHFVDMNTAIPQTDGGGKIGEEIMGLCHSQMFQITALELISIEILVIGSSKN